MPKNKRNGFYYFMVAKQDEISRRERRKVGMQELSTFLYNDWKNLSDVERKKYENMKDDYIEEKLDSRGIPISQIQQELKNAQKKEENMKENIEDIVKLLKASKSLHRKHFYILCISYYTKNEMANELVPAEVGLCKYSFVEGIVATYSAILAPELPPGYKLSAKEHSEATHNLLMASRNIYTPRNKVPQDIRAFIKETGADFPPLYARGEKLADTEAMLKSIMGKKDDIKVYSLDYFFACLYSEVMQPLPVSVAEDFLDNCSFDYITNIPCDWHKTHAPDAGKYCALGICKISVYHMCDRLNVKTTFNVEPKAGHHVPGVLKTTTRTIKLSNEFDRMSLQSSGSSVREKSEGSNPWGRNESVLAESESEFPSLMASSGRPGVAAADAAPGAWGASKPNFRMGGVGRGRNLKD